MLWPAPSSIWRLVESPADPLPMLAHTRCGPDTDVQLIVRVVAVSTALPASTSTVPNAIGPKLAEQPASARVHPSAPTSTRRAGHRRQNGRRPTCFMVDP